MVFFKETIPHASATGRRHFRRDAGIFRLRGGFNLDLKEAVFLD
jgi:hypothetical protein